VRILCSRFLVVVAFGLLSMGLGGLCGCGADKSDGLAEEAQIDPDQKAEVKSQYQKQRLERLGKSAQKRKAGRAK
jgi:hypothetical protein